jgi:hypothetical protein
MKIDMLPKVKNRHFLTPELAPIFTTEEKHQGLILGTDTRRINTGFTELDVKKFVNGGGSTIRLAVCCFRVVNLLDSLIIVVVDSVLLVLVVKIFDSAPACHIVQKLTMSS